MVTPAFDTYDLRPRKIAVKIRCMTSASCVIILSYVGEFQREESGLTLPSLLVSFQDAFGYQKASFEVSSRGSIERNRFVAVLLISIFIQIGNYYFNN